MTIKDEQGGQLGAVPNTVYQTDVFAKYGDEADAEIARIIQANEGNAGPGVGSAAKASVGRPVRDSAHPESKSM